MNFWRWYWKTQTPISKTQNPTRKIQNPTRITQIPTKKTQNPTRVSQNPTRIAQTSTRKTQNPTRTTKNPIRTTQNPTRTTQNPTRTTKNPTRTTKNPTRTTQNPTRTTQNPTRTTQNPTRTTQNPINTNAKTKDSQNINKNTNPFNTKPFKWASKIFNSLKPEDTIEREVGKNKNGKFKIGANSDSINVGGELTRNKGLKDITYSGNLEYKKEDGKDTVTVTGGKNEQTKGHFIQQKDVNMSFQVAIYMMMIRKDMKFHILIDK